MHNTSRDEGLSVPRHVNVNEAESVRQPGQGPWPRSPRNDRSYPSSVRYDGPADYEPRQRQGERSVYEGYEPDPYREHSNLAHRGNVQPRGGLVTSSEVPWREEDQRERNLRNRGNWPLAPPNQEEEVNSILQEWQQQLNESRTEVMDYQQRVLVNQQEIEDLNNVSNELQSELSLTRRELQHLKANNVATDEKFQKLWVLERQNVARLREAENRCSGLEQRLSSILKEKAEALARVEELRSFKSSLELRLEELETKAEVVAKLELQAKSMAEKMVKEKVEEHNQKEVVKQRELQGLHNRAALALEEAKREKHHLSEENERLKQELRSVKIQLSKQPGGLLTRNSASVKKALHFNIKQTPQRYDGPLKGKNNLFWLKFRNPELKEQLEGQESPPVTPTSTPESSPDLK